MKLTTIVKKKGYVHIPDEVVQSSAVGSIKSVLPTAKWTGSKHKTWKVLATDHNIGKVNDIFKSDISLNIKHDQVPVDISKLKTVPYSHQIEALSRGVGREFFGYLLDMGLGKSKVTIDDAILTKVDAVLVACPKSVLPVWEEQLLEHSYMKKEQIAIWPDLPQSLPADMMQWFIINYDALIFDKGFRAAEAFLLSSSTTMIVCDESTVIKSVKLKRKGMDKGQKALRNTALTKLKPLSNYRRILSGTPMDQIPDLYGQLNWLDESVVYHRNFYAFRNRYCVMGGYMGKRVVATQNEKELKKIMDDHTIRIRLEDAVDMPERIFQTRYVTLGRKGSSLYREVSNKLIVDIDDNKISMAQAMVRLTKLQQITGGVVKGDEGPIYTGKEKVEEVKTVIERSGRLPCLIWVQYKEEILLLEQELSGKYEVESISGSTKDRKAVIGRFKDGLIDILIIQNDTGSMGLNLTEANLSIYYSNSLSSIVRRQSERRNYRIGQKEKVLYVDVVCKDLIDEHVLKILKRKEDVSNVIVDSNSIKGLI